MVKHAMHEFLCAIVSVMRASGIILQGWIPALGIIVWVMVSAPFIGLLLTRYNTWQILFAMTYSSISYSCSSFESVMLVSKCSYSHTLVLHV